MPVMKKEFELEDGTKITVKQAGGMRKLKIENIQAKVFRDHMHFGTDPTKWTDEQQRQFADAMDDAGAGMEAQIEQWMPNCIIEPADFDLETLTSMELREILGFVRGDDPEGAIPLGSSQE
jgi:hypothetical protein|tara:strand:+ start:56 stop:418 length:363 start_codon:yes stop_codon:yes gene_type:complete